MATGSTGNPTNAATGYESYSQDHSYEHDLGVIVLPTASREPGHKLIRLHGGVAVRRVKWEATRKGKPPVIPAAGDTNYDTLLHSTAVMALPAISGSQYMFGAHGEYLYVQTAPRVPGVDTLPTASFPFGVTLLDEQANKLAGSILARAQSIGESENPFNDLANAIAAAVVKDNNDYTWPFTFMPAQFTATTIVA